MPRKTKEKEVSNKIIENETKKNKVKNDKKHLNEGNLKDISTSNSKKFSEKEKIEKISSKKSSTKSKENKTSTKSITKKASTKSEEKLTSTKKINIKSEKKKISAKKETNKTSSKRSSKKSSTTDNTSIDLNILEYYDLPYKYGNTLVKLLAQTPKTLFVYWEISDLDIQEYKKQFGEDFFKNTKPILIVHNLTLNKTYEVEINDFANCWYLNTEDTDCKFDIELARKFIKPHNSSTDNYLHIAKSNNLNSPNDHILFEKLFDNIIFTNTKTGEKSKKDIKSFTFLNDLYTFYKNMYKDELLKNPSSNFLLQ